MFCRYLRLLFCFADKSSNALSNLANPVHSPGMVEPVPVSVSDDDIDAGGGRPYPGDDATEEEDLESKRRYAWFGLGKFTL